jgi:hypothetical protein
LQARVPAGLRRSTLPNQAARGRPWAASPSGLRPRQFAQAPKNSCRSRSMKSCSASR